MLSSHGTHRLWGLSQHVILRFGAYWDRFALLRSISCLVYRGVVPAPHYCA